MKVFEREINFIDDNQIESIAPKGEVLLFDIETTGLKKETTQVYLIGCGFYENGTWKIRQYLAESALDEKEVMEEFLSFAAAFKTIVTFNGDMFDVPYIIYKADYYGIEFPFTELSFFDIYKKAKTLKNCLNLPKMSQKSIEAFLGIKREDLLNGGLLIPYFYEYERTNDPETERLLLLHNYDDVQGMFKILDILKFMQITEGAFRFEHLEKGNHTMDFYFELEKALPVSFSSFLEKKGILLSAFETHLTVRVALFEGEVRLPLQDVENYYYLPEEDRVIHKDVAEYVDKKFRKKATKSNCFLKKEGSFLPQYGKQFQPAFLAPGEKKKTYFEAEKILSLEGDVIREYILDILSF